jgi:DHA1 family bicyclomycin/chloramphenicol resistance-like MFS transporter
MDKQKTLGGVILPLLTALVALGQLSIDLYLPSLPNLANDLSVEPKDAQLTLSAYLVGFALANIFHGPLADRYGRRPVLLGGLAVYVLASGAMIVAADIDWLVWLRFLQAVGSCAASVVCRTMVRDIYGAEGAGRAMSYLTAGGSVALAIGPIIGGFVAEMGGWRGNFAVLLVYGIVVSVLAGFYLPETNPGKSAARITPLEIARTYGALIRNRLFIGNVMCATFAYAGIFCFISASSFVLIDVMGLHPSLYGVCFAALVGGFIAGATLSGKLNKRIGATRLIRVGWTLAIAAGVSMILFLEFAPGVVAILAPMFLYEMAVGLILGNAIGGALAPFPKSAGAASSLLGLTQTGIASILGALLGQIATLTALPMALSILVSGMGAAAMHVFVVRPKS